MAIPCTCRACGFINQAELSQAGQAIACRGCGKTLTVSPPVVTFRCPACNRKFVTKAELAGKKIRCSGCGAGVRVPAGDGGIAALSGSVARLPATVKFRCPSCQQVSEAPADRAGEAVPCGGCGQVVRIPAAQGTATAQPSRPALQTFGANGGAQAQAAAASRPKANGDGDDMSSALHQLASIEGIESPARAGTSLSSRSAMLEQARQRSAAQAAEEEEAEQEKKKKKKKKKKRKKAGASDAKDTLVLVAGVGVVVGVLALVAWKLPDLRFPLGGLLCVVGFVVYLLGWASLRQLVAEEGMFQVLLFRFFPPYQLWFVLRNWVDTRDYVAFFAAGLMIMGIGGAVIKTSDVGKRAAAADRAIEKARQATEAGAPPVAAGAAGDDEG
jgi:ribosomal protein S27E